MNEVVAQNSVSEDSIPPQLALFCQSQMSANAKTFSFASKFFSSENRVSAQALYAWCRYCDDQIDDAGSRQQAKLKLAELFEKTAAALSGTPTTELPFQALQHIFAKYDIPVVYAIELLRGMQMDVEGYEYKTEDDLKLYCYRVAGVVGLMMTHIMGIDDPRALKNAADAGIAMQMTNIARDVAEDLSMGRIYLPEEWFQDLKIRPLSVTELMDGKRAWPVVEKLLITADERYRSGREGIKNLPLAAAFAISTAIDIYSDIGNVIRERRELAWQRRAYIPLYRKILRTVISSFGILGTAVVRLFHPWKPQVISETYNFQP